MTNVHTRHPLRGTLHAPVVTIDHAEAERLRQQQKDAFWSSPAGTVAAMLVGVSLLFGLPMLVAAIVFGATAALWTPVVVAAGLVTMLVHAVLTSD